MTDQDAKDFMLAHRPPIYRWRPVGGSYGWSSPRLRRFPDGAVGHYGVSYAEQLRAARAFSGRYRE